MAIAAMWGSSVGYTISGDSIWIETSDGRVAVVRKDTFDYLYSRLDDFTAALKENCIEYTLVYGDVVEMINFMGDVKHMELDEFESYYDTLGG